MCKQVWDVSRHKGPQVWRVSRQKDLYVQTGDEMCHDKRSCMCKQVWRCVTTKGLVCANRCEMCHDERSSCRDVCTRQVTDLYVQTGVRFVTTKGPQVWDELTTKVDPHVVKRNVLLSLSKVLHNVTCKITTNMQDVLDTCVKYQQISSPIHSFITRGFKNCSLSAWRL